MDVCKPNLLWINNSCYRLNTLDDGFETCQQHYEGAAGVGDVADVYEDEIGCGMENTPEINDCQYDIVLNGNRFKASFHVSSAFFGLIIGKKGMTRKRIESDTRTKIAIPGQGKEDQDVQITGDSKQSVALACNRIDSIVADARKKMGFTHFLSIPCNNPELQSAFQEFQTAVLESCSDSRGLDESVFQTPTLLHMTIGTLALMDENERQKAKDILEESLKEMSLSKPLEILIEGLEIMNDDPSEVDVVYGKVKNSEELQKLADFLVAKFAESGLMPRQFDRVKLHVTLLNTIFRKGTEDLESNSSASGRETLDSRAIMQHFGDFHFGSMILEEIHLSQRRAGKRTKENYYFPSAIVKL